MHPHLHTRDNARCEEVMTALDECHARGFLWKSMGMCSDLKRQVNRCLRAERVARQARNREEARVRRERWRKAEREWEADE